MPKPGGFRPQAQTPAVMALQAKFNQAVALHQQGKLMEAERVYERVLRRQPQYFDALHLLGVIAAQTKRPERAVQLIKKAIRANPEIAAAHNNLGNVELQLKRFEDALASYDRAIALKPDFADAYNNRGNVLRELGRPEDALASHDRAIALKSNFAEAHINRGITLLELQRNEEALASCEKAIELKPHFADAYDNRGIALLNMKRLDEALASYDQAIALKPDYAEAYNNRAVALLKLRRLEEALICYEKAITLKPDDAEAYNSRGFALAELNRPEEALASCAKAIALKPDFADAHWNQSLCLLLLGRLEPGWRQFEWRKKLKTPLGLRSYRQRLWLGEEDIAGKTLFIYWEQGLGDTIQFCRYAPLVEARGAKVIMSVQQPLIELLKQLSPTMSIVGPDAVPIDFDYHCPLMSLPLALKTTLSNIPATIPYLRSNAEKSSFWKDKLGKKDKPRVGLVWSGGFRPDQPELWSVNRRRNIPLAKLAPLRNADIEFYSLQKGQPAESELADLIRDNWDGPDIADFTSALKDFSDTAALIDNLDLVISVDTSTAHLAGALGKPVWILNRFDTDWRWLLDRTDSPWYPSVTLYRQEEAGNWDDVVAHIKIDLEAALPPTVSDDRIEGRSG
jgi:tetratricopeptide (TPR) repeat protein